MGQPDPQGLGPVFAVTVARPAFGAVIATRPSQLAGLYSFLAGSFAKHVVFSSDIYDPPRSSNSLSRSAALSAAAWSLASKAGAQPASRPRDFACSVLCRQH